MISFKLKCHIELIQISILFVSALSWRSVGVLLMFLAALVCFDELVKLVLFRPFADKRAKKRRRIAELAGTF